MAYVFADQLRAIAARDAPIWSLPYVLFVAGQLSWTAYPLAAQETAQTVDPAALVLVLSDGAYEKREEAARQLIKLGKDSIPLLVEATRKYDVNLSQHAVAILRDICFSPDDETWRTAQKALQQIADGDNRLAALFAKDAIRSQSMAAEQRLLRLGSKRITARSTLTLPATWSGGKDGLVNLRWLPELRTIRIEGANLHPQALANLRYAQQLQHLVIVNVPIDDQVFEYLSLVPDLETLYLSGTKITDRGLSALKGHNKLSCLEIQQTEISDASVDVLASLQGLRRLQIADTRISDGGVARLRKALPRTNIYMSRNQ